MENVNREVAMRKGTLRWGGVGLGKTMRMKADYAKHVPANERCESRMLTADEVADIAMEKGLAGIRQLASSYMDLYIDDIGHEPATVTCFGTVLSPVKELIKMRYRLSQESPTIMITHFTTNMSPDDVKDRYGDYILDRLVEMCEWEQFEGTSFRK